MLIVHPSRHVADILTTILGTLRLDFDHAENEAEALRRVGQPFALMVAVVDPTEPNALGLLAFSRRKQPWLPVLVMLMTPDAGQASEALRLGAVAVVDYRCPPANLRESVSAVLRATRSERRSATPADSKPERREREREREPVGLLPEHQGSARPGPLKDDVEHYERLLLVRALGALDWNKKETARVLGINRTTLYFKMKKYGL